MLVMLQFTAVSPQFPIVVEKAATELKATKPATHSLS